MEVPRERINVFAPLPATPLKKDVCAASTQSRARAVQSPLKDKAQGLLVTPELLTCELKQMLIDIQNQVSATAVRQDQLFAELISSQRDLHKELSGSRSMARAEARAQNVRHSTRTDASALSFLTSTSLSRQNKQTQVRSNSAEGPNEKAHGDEYLSQPDRGSNLTVEQSSSKRISEIVMQNVSKLTSRASKFHAVVGVSGSSLSLDENQPLKKRLASLLRSKTFEMLIAVILMCNTIVMCWESQYYGLELGYDLKYETRLKPAASVWPGAEEVFNVLEWFFGILLLLEFLVKILSWRLKYFHQKTNWLDFFCVVVFVLDKSTADLLGNYFNPHVLRLFRLFRLARLVRLIRFVESLEALYVMTTAISGLSRILGWAVFLLTLMLLACDLFMVQLLHSTYFAEVTYNDLTAEQLKKHHQMYSYFGTVSRCMLSMFEITLGNWPEIARVLTEEVSQWFIILCLAHKLTVGFAVIGVITGVILQETFKVAQTNDIIMLRAKKRQGEVLKKKLERFFVGLDKDRNGRVDMSEFRDICEDEDVKTWLASLDIETDDLAKLFELCDYDENGVLSMEEICTRMPRIMGRARSIDVLNLNEQIRRSGLVNDTIRDSAIAPEGLTLQ